jgi:zinc protease
VRAARAVKTVKAARVARKPAVASAPAFRPLHLPGAVRTRLRNGLEVVVVRRPQLPLVTARLLVRAGAALDPVDRPGLADFTARLMRRGAAGESGEALSEQIDRLGASLGGSASEDAFGLYVGGRARHFDALLDLLGKVLLSPDFPDAEVELARRRSLAGMKNELDDPGTLAEKQLMRSIYGAHPYGSEVGGRAASVTALTRGQLVAFHAQKLGPLISELYLVGDIDPETATRRIDAVLGGWKGGPTGAPQVPKFEALGRPGEVVIVDKPDQTQVQVRLGAYGLPRGQPDHFPTALMSTVLGGGFTSRLVSEIRVKRGLSYGAGCHFEWMKDGGSFVVSSFTRTATVATLLDVAIAEVDKMREKGPTAKELSSAQRYLSGLYPVRVETNDALAGTMAEVSLYGLGPEWIEKFRERVVAVTVDEARAAAHARLPAPERSARTIVLVGNAAELTAVAEKYGKVSVIKPADLE